METDVLDLLGQAFRKVAGVRAWVETDKPSTPSSQYRPDAIMNLDVDGRPISLVVEIKKSIFPRDVPRIVWQLKAYAADLARDGVERLPFVAADAISEGARELLTNERMGYFDTSGSLYLSSGTIFMVVDRPVPKTMTKKVSSVFHGKRANVLRVMLEARDWLGVKELARRAMVSSGTASETLTALERLDWADSRGEGPHKERRLADATSLLDGWTRNLLASKAPTKLQYYVSGRSPADLCRDIDLACESNAWEYAFSSETASQHYAPHLTAVKRVFCRPGSHTDIDALAKRLRARRVEEGANLIVLVGDEDGPLLGKQRSDELWYVSPLQTYLDLLVTGGRGPEAAKFLRERVLEA